MIYPPLDIRRIVLDPGHGGDNTGTHDDELIEKDITLAICLELERSLRESPIDCNIYMTRTHDFSLSQKDRGHFSKEAMADLVISVHVNASTSPQAKGVQAYHWPGSQTGFIVSNMLVDTMCNHMGSGKVIEAHAPTCDAEQWLENPRAIQSIHIAPCIVLEVGFRTNPQDKEKLLCRYERSELVSNMRAAVARFLKWSRK